MRSSKLSRRSHPTLEVRVFHLWRDKWTALSGPLSSRRGHLLSFHEATQGHMDGFCSQLPYKCHQNRVASVGDWLKLCPWVIPRVARQSARKHVAVDVRNQTFIQYITPTTNNLHTRPGPRTRLAPFSHVDQGSHAQPGKSGIEMA